MTPVFHIAAKPRTSRYRREAEFCAPANGGLRIDARLQGVNTLD